MTGELVHLEVAGGIATVTLDSPDNRNALSRRLFADLQRQIDLGPAGAGPHWALDLKRPPSWST